MLINHTIKSSLISFLAEYRKWKGSEGHFMGIKISDLLGPPVGLFWPGHTHSHYEHFTLCQLKYCHKFTRLCLLVFLGLTATFWWLMKIRESILIPPLREKIITQSQKCCCRMWAAIGLYITNGTLEERWRWPLLATRSIITHSSQRSSLHLA